LRFVKYQTTSLEKNYKFQLHNEPDMGIVIDLIDPSVYKPPPSSKSLLQEDFDIVYPPENGKEQKPKTRNGVLRPSVPWLKKTQYITASVEENIRKPDNKDKKSVDQSQYMTRSDQIKVIEETFELAKISPKHPTNPNLVSEEIFDVFPNEDLWPNHYNQVLFDGDPVPVGSENFPKDEAILKGYAFQQGEGKVTNVLGYLVPQKRKRDLTEEIKEGEEEEYDWVREYTYSTKPEQDNYFFIFTKDYVYYAPIKNRVNISKAKQATSIARPAKVTLLHKELTLEEQDEREDKKNELLQPELLQKKHQIDETDEIRDEE